MKSLIPLLQAILQDMEDQCCTSTTRDLQTITSRVEHEGLSFLTITLPKFAKDFERSLEQGFVSSDLFAGFQRRGGLPKFLSGFLRFVFDARSGELLPDPSLPHLQAVRQITRAFGKIELPCSDARKQAAFDKFVETDRETEAATRQMHPSDWMSYRRVASMLWGDLLSVVDREVYTDGVRPKHGSGTTAEKKLGNAKWLFTEWPERLDTEFPLVDYLVPNPRYWKHLEPVVMVAPEHERPVRVVDVPKTLETPRIIGCEPVCMQYVQQGLLSVFVRAVQASDTARQLIGNESQEPNKALARSGSEDGSLATLDLKEASDRVSNQHVQELLRNHGTLRRAVDACRSRSADVPGHGVIPLAKFASMGSALTFQMEALVFCTVVFVGIEQSLGRPLRRSDVKSLLGRVRVYGDDIIVPVEYVHDVVASLERHNFQVNRRKSFWTGKFRESCGGEYYSGHDVSVVKVRSSLPTHVKNAEEILSTVEFRNHAYLAGMWKTARYLDRLLERLIPFPAVLPESPVLGRTSFLGYSTEKMCPRLHRPLVKGVVAKSVIPSNPLDDVPALLKVLTNDSGLPNPDVKHLERSGRPRAIALHTRWSTPY